MENNQEEQVVYENETIEIVEKQEKQSKGKLIPLWIIVPVLFVLTSVITWYYYAVALSTFDSIEALGGVFIFIFAFIVGVVGYSLTALASTIGVILTCVIRPNKLRVGQLIFFILVIILCAICVAAMFLIPKLL